MTSGTNYITSDMSHQSGNNLLLLLHQLSSTLMKSTHIQQRGELKPRSLRNKSYSSGAGCELVSVYKVSACVYVCMFVCMWSRSREKLKDHHQENDQLMKHLVTKQQRQRQRHILSTRPWYLAASVDLFSPSDDISIRNHLHTSY